MLGTDFTKNKKAQSGSVMLEVIAVLALMGVMGAMLFRQIYQRNQELHNIQMASEIRTVKEAFSAYIQAYRTELFSACNPGPLCSKDSAEIGKAISQFLPAGWFADSKVENYYTFTMWSYIQDEVTNKRIIYGLIAPKETTLPQTGWNFKRAARVALLIGADGGVYGDGITSGQIAGALGTWHLDEHSDMGLEPATYVAMTGLDIFTPEYNLPEGNVNLREDWDLATRKLGAWNYFSAGSDKATCFDVNHHISLETGGVMQVEQDTFNACQPLFYVDKEKSKVFVNNDLEIGQGENANVTITQEGVIKQKNGLTIDKDGRIISGNKVGKTVGDLTTDDRYVVDPAYTSTMNDIRLASRGGVRLSDILPNYILKAQQGISGNGTITIPTCPEGYTKALVVMPVSWDQTLTKDGASIATDSFEVTVPAANIKTASLIKENTLLVNTTDGKVISDTTISGSGREDAKGKADLTKLKVTEGVCVKITKGGTTSETGLKSEDATDTGTWDVTLGYKNNAPAGNCVANTTVSAIVQTYCVAPDLSGVPDKDNEASCEGAGFTWNTTKGCVYQYVGCATIDTGNNGGTPIGNKAAVCKAADCKWNGTSCTNP